MKSSLLYSYILILALTVAAISFLTGDINLRVSHSAFNRYEFYLIFMYCSNVYIILKLSNSQSDETKNITLEPINFMGSSIPSNLVIFLLTFILFLCVFITT